MQFFKRSLGILKFSTLRLLISSYKKDKTHLAKFGKAKRALQRFNIETISHFYQAKISNQGLRKENWLFER